MQPRRKRHWSPRTGMGHRRSCCFRVNQTWTRTCPPPPPAAGRYRRRCAMNRNPHHCCMASPAPGMPTTQADPPHAGSTPRGGQWCWMPPCPACGPRPVHQEERWSWSGMVAPEIFIGMKTPGPGTFRTWAVHRRKPTTPAAAIIRDGSMWRQGRSPKRRDDWMTAGCCQAPQVPGPRPAPGPRSARRGTAWRAAPLQGCPPGPSC